MEAATGLDWWQFLAVELKQLIWSHLDVKEIINATTVCSDWRNSLFADQHQPWATIFQRCLGGPGPQKGVDGRPMATWCKHLISEFQGWNAALKQGTALSWCCSHGHHILFLNLLLANQQGLQNNLNSPGPATLTHKPNPSSPADNLFLDAVEAGHSHILLILIEHKMRILRPSTLSSMVECASEKGHAQILSILLANGHLLTPLPPKAKKGHAGSLICGRKMFSDSLFAACKNGDVGVVKVLLDHHPEKDAAVNVVQEVYTNAPTAMHHACRGGSVDMVRFLLASGVQSWESQPFELKKLVEPPLFVAIKYGHFDIVKMLVEEQASAVNETGPSGSAYKMAADSDRPEILRYLVNRPECVQYGELESALSAACSADNIACVRILLEADPQMNCYYATEIACNKGYLPIIKMLVEFQPQIIEQASSGASPCLLQAAIWCAARFGNEDVLSFLLEKGVSPNTHPPGSACPLATALLQGDSFGCNFDRLGVIQKLIRAGADVNKLVENPSLQSLSFFALKTYISGKPSVEVLRELVDAGLDLSTKEKISGSTLLHFRAELQADPQKDADRASANAVDVFLCHATHNWETQRIIEDHNNKGYDRPNTFVDTPNCREETPLVLAVLNGRIPLIKALLKCGPDVLPAYSRLSLLHLFISEEGKFERVEKRRKKTAKLLRQYQAITDKVCPQKEKTLLHEACMKGRTGLVRALLEKGNMDPNCTIPDPKGGDPITPLMISISLIDVETVELLIERGAIVGDSERKALPPWRGQQLAKLRDLLAIPPLQADSQNPSKDIVDSSLDAEDSSIPSSSFFSFPFSTTTSTPASATTSSIPAATTSTTSSTPFSFNPSSQNSGFSFSGPSDQMSSLEDSSVTLPFTFVFGGNSSSS